MTNAEILAQLDDVRDRVAMEEDAAERERVTRLVELFTSRTSGVAELVATYADARNPALVRNIAFQLSLASKPENHTNTAGLVWDLISRLRVDDDGVRVNVLTAIVYLWMGGRLPVELPAEVFPFLLVSLDRGELVQSGVAQVVGNLWSAGCLERWPREQVATLRARLLALIDHERDDSLLQDELRGLADFFVDTGRTEYPVPEASTELLLGELATVSSYDHAWAIVRVIAKREGGLAQLVERFGSAMDVMVIRTLTLALERAARDPASHDVIVPLVWRMTGELRVDDAKTWANLLDALGFILSAHDRRAFARSAPTPLIPFLLAALEHVGRHVRIEAARRISDLAVFAYLVQLDGPQREALRSGVRAARERATDDDRGRLDELLAQLGG